MSEFERGRAAALLSIITDGRPFGVGGDPLALIAGRAVAPQGRARRPEDSPGCAELIAHAQRIKGHGAVAERECANGLCTNAVGDSRAVNEYDVPICAGCAGKLVGNGSKVTRSAAAPKKDLGDLVWAAMQDQHIQLSPVDQESTINTASKPVEDLGDAVVRVLRGDL